MSGSRREAAHQPARAVARAGQGVEMVFQRPARAALRTRRGLTPTGTIGPELHGRSRLCGWLALL